MKGADSMFHIYIIEDNTLFSKSIKDMIQHYTKLSSGFCIESIAIINDSFDLFMESLSKSSLKNNIYIIDIDLNANINGLQIAKRIRSFDFSGYIIFLTSHIEMTAVTFHYNLKALNFIYKGDPHLQHLLFTSFDQIVLETSNTPASEALPANHTGYFSYAYKLHFYKIPYSDILLIETHGLKRHLIIHTLEKTYECAKPIKDILSQLPPSFIQCHRSYIVNVQYIKELKLEDSQYLIVLNQDMHCPTSKKYLSVILNHMQMHSK